VRHDDAYENRVLYKLGVLIPEVIEKRHIVNDEKNIFLLYFCNRSHINWSGKNLKIISENGIWLSGGLTFIKDGLGGEYPVILLFLPCVNSDKMFQEYFESMLFDGSLAISQNQIQ